MVSHPPRTALIVEDDPSCMRLLAKLLNSAGLETVNVADGVAALDVLTTVRPLIILTDWLMPRLDGIQLIREIRARELDWYPYIILLTASDSIAEGLDSGADDFITKPIRHDTLLPRVRAGIRSAQLHDDLRRRYSELNESNRRLSKLATTDPLSGLMNRRSFLEHAEVEWQRAQRHGAPLTAMMVDIDHFKRINDTYGHPAGDDVIRRLGELLRERLRENDIICRYGGEEFAVLLPETTLDEGSLTAEKLRNSVLEMLLPDFADEHGLSVSLGLAARSWTTLSSSTLIDQADQSLLAAKRSGRNRVARYDEVQTSGQLLANGGSELRIDSSRVDSAALIPFHVVNALIATLELRDAQTMEHSRRVADICRRFGYALGLDPAERLTLEIAALLHDMGKAVLPDEVLKQWNSLTADERAPLGQHRRATVEILSTCFSNQRLLDIVGLVDQWYDGSRGQPAGGDIPGGGRVLAIVNAYDHALHGLESGDVDQALSVVCQRAGTHLDPELVEQFVTLIKGSGATVVEA